MPLTSFQTTAGTWPVRSASSTLRNGSPARVLRLVLRCTAKVASTTCPSSSSSTHVSPAIGGQSIRLLAMSSTATRTALEPLRALRYDQSKVARAEVIAPPYDIVTEPQRDSLIRRCQYCVVRLELPESPQTAATLAHERQRDVVLARDERPALWWHEQTFTGPDGVDRVRKGFFAALRLSPYDEGRVR